MLVGHSTWAPARRSTARRCRPLPWLCEKLASSPCGLLLCLMSGLALEVVLGDKLPRRELRSQAHAVKDVLPRHRGQSDAFQKTRNQFIVSPAWAEQSMG